MKYDPIVEEVREARQKLAEKCQFNLKKIFADAQSRETSSGHPLVHREHCVCEEPAEYKTKPWSERGSLAAKRRRIRKKGMPTI